MQRTAFRCSFLNPYLRGAGADEYYRCRRTRAGRLRDIYRRIVFPCVLHRRRGGFAMIRDRAIVADESLPLGVTHSSFEADLLSISRIFDFVEPNLALLSGGDRLNILTDSQSTLAFLTNSLKRSRRTHIDISGGEFLTFGRERG